MMFFLFNFADDLIVHLKKEEKSAAKKEKKTSFTSYLKQLMAQLRKHLNICTKKEDFYIDKTFGLISRKKQAKINACITDSSNVQISYNAVSIDVEQKENRKQDITQTREIFMPKTPVTIHSFLPAHNSKVGELEVDLLKK